MSTTLVDTRKRLGQRAEVFAAEYLDRTLGYVLFAQNWRCRRGELDVVCWDESCLVVVEVRSKSNGRFGPIETAVSPSKARRIVSIVPWLLQEPRLKAFETFRFDVITVAFRQGEIHRFHHVREAFDATI